MRRVSTISSSNGNNNSSNATSPHSQERPLLNLVHGPWNRKSIATILSQQQQEQHYCYGGRDEHANTNINTTADNGDGHSTTATTTITTTTTPAPSYTLWDLVSVGVGGTVGSGIFVLTGYINHHYAGPATFLSFAVSGLAALCSGISFAEFSGRLPRIEGSTYTYTYVSMGEYAAVLAAACLTLEYGVSGAAVARSWGDKVLEWTTTKNDVEVDADVDQQREAFFNPLAGFISFLSVVILACGVQESKKVTNFFTVAKLLLVGVMIVGGFCLFSVSNVTPLLVPSYGVAGVLRGATSSFFGYLGFDEVCCLASEAKNPSDTPRAVLYTLAIVTCIYILASVALSGMLPYDKISDTSGFPNAFGALGHGWVANLTAFGEVATLPVVVLISLLAQPRLCAAMARDGLLPAIFCRRSGKDGNLFWSSILCGIPMTLLATFVPFSWMDDAISVGILFAFNMTNTALIVVRCGTDGAAATAEEQEVVIAVDEANAIVSSTFPPPKQYGSFLRRRCWSLPVHLGCYHFVALMAGLTSHLNTTTTVATENGPSSTSSPNWSLQIGAAALTLAYAVVFHRQFPTTGTFGDASLLLQTQYRDSNVETENNTVNDNDHNHGIINSNDIFQVPMCPFLPLVGIYLNWYLISQLEWNGMILLFVFLVIISALYCFCISGSSQTQIPPSMATPSSSCSYLYSDAPHLGREAAGATPAPITNTAQQLDADGPILLREMSMPSRRTIT